MHSIGHRRRGLPIDWTAATYWEGLAERDVAGSEEGPDTAILYGESHERRCRRREPVSLLAGRGEETKKPLKLTVRSGWGGFWQGVFGGSPARAPGWRGGGGERAGGRLAGGRAGRWW